jgi:hypothetical protein
MPPKAKVYSERWRLRDRPIRIDGTTVDMIQALRLEPRIMRYELGDDEWTAIKAMLPNRQCGV